MPKFNHTTLVLVFWDNKPVAQIQVTGKQHAWKVSRDNLAKGYSVAWTTALIDAMIKE